MRKGLGVPENRCTPFPYIAQNLPARAAAPFSFLPGSSPGGSEIRRVDGFGMEGARLLIDIRLD